MLTAMEWSEVVNNAVTGLLSVGALLGVLWFATRGE